MMKILNEQTLVNNFLPIPFEMGSLISQIEKKAAEIKKIYPNCMPSRTLEQYPHTTQFIKDVVYNIYDTLEYRDVGDKKILINSYENNIKLNFINDIASLGDPSKKTYEKLADFMEELNIFAKSADLKKSPWINPSKKVMQSLIEDCLEQFDKNFMGLNRNKYYYTEFKEIYSKGLNAIVSFLFCENKAIAGSIKEVINKKLASFIGLAVGVFSGWKFIKSHFDKQAA